MNYKTISYFIFFLLFIETNNSVFAQVKSEVFKNELNEHNKAIIDNNKEMENYNNPAYSDYVKGVDCLQKEKYKKAKKYLTLSINKNKGFDIAYLKRGKANFGLNKFNEALLDLNEAINLNPELAEAWYIKGTIYLQLNDKVKACDSWQTASLLGHSLSKLKSKENCF